MKKAISFFLGAICSFAIISFKCCSEKTALKNDLNNVLDYYRSRQIGSKLLVYLETKNGNFQSCKIEEYACVACPETDREDPKKCMRSCLTLFFDNGKSIHVSESIGVTRVAAQDKELVALYNKENDSFKHFAMKTFRHAWTGYPNNFEDCSFWISLTKQ